MIPVVVVAHPRRARLVDRLAREVRPEAIVWDDAGYGCAKNHLRAWKWLADAGSGWGVVVEDDVAAVPRFRDHLTSAITRSPSRILSLYLGRSAMPHLQERVAAKVAADASYLLLPTLLSAQAYAMPADLFARHREVERRTRRQLPIDEAIGNWAASHGMPVAHARHSLVEHLAVPSLIDDHGDGQSRDGATRLTTADSDPSGTSLPEQRQAWLLATPSTDWARGAVTA